MESLLILLAFPLVWPLIAKYIWPREISSKELLLNIGIIVLLVTVIWQAGKYNQTLDTEIWNGEVTHKEKNWVSCSHSYRCNCRTVSNGSGNHKTETEVCDTCYEHTNDWNWDVYSTAGGFTISRVDRRGSYEPPRWTKVYVGEPVAIEHDYTNYIKGAPDSLFHFAGDLKKIDPKMLPSYPTVFDYQYVNRVIPIGLNLPEMGDWNKKIALELRKLGPYKGVNIVVVAINNPDQGYVHILEQHWIGGKKNDVIVVLGIDQYPKISWAYVMTWSKEELFKIELRDALLNLGTVNNSPVVETIVSHINKGFIRRSMTEFEYLKDEIDPPTWVIILVVLLATAGSVGLSFHFRQTDIH